MTMSSDLGSVFFGTDFASAVDNNDYAQGAARYQTNGQIISSGWMMEMQLLETELVYLHL
jgi:hypothetical protein